MIFSLRDYRPVHYGTESYLRRVYAETSVTNEELELLNSIYARLTLERNFEYNVIPVMSSHHPFKVARMFSWFEFLLDITHDWLFSSLCTDVAWCFNNELFLNEQTQWQFEQCKSIISEYNKVATYVFDFQQTRNTLLCFCILSVRPDFQKASIRQLAEKLADHYPPFSKKSFQLLLAGDESLSFLGDYLQYLTRGEINLLLELLEGKSLRKLLGPKTISKTENSILLQNVIKLPGFKDHILERHILAARILKNEVDKVETLTRMLSLSATFRYDLNMFCTDFNFWRNLFHILKKKKNVTITQLSWCIDYIEYKRYRDVTPLSYSLKGRTFQSIERAMTEWHHSPEYFIRKKDLSITWPSLPLPSFEKKIARVTYTIKEINSGKELLRESQTMKHCVYSYLDRCQRGKSHIFRLMEHSNSSNRYLATLEIRDGTVIQIGGKHNHQPVGNDIALIEEWAQQRGLQLDIQQE